MSYEIICAVCGRESKNLIDYKCRECGSPLDVKLNTTFDIEEIQNKIHGVWRYKKFFPYVKASEIITLGEGWTPLVKFSENLYFKLENLNPTGSFKDRGSTMLISAVYKQIKACEGYIAEDSSGNAGASIAAYASRAGLRAKIYVPENVSGIKFNQIMFYGAEVAKVRGTRNRVADEAQKPGKGKFYIGHILHPLFRDGIRSLAYEIAEQLDLEILERVYLPVSAGTLLLGVTNGFRHMEGSSVIKDMPKIIACQTRRVSPLYHRFKGLLYQPPKKINSIADALASTNPPLLELMVKSLREVNGDAVIVEEEEILQAFKDLAKIGFFVEPSSAVAYAAYQKQLRNFAAARKEKTVVILTGTGLKTTIKPS